MSFLYLTADKIGIETGGGVVTANESQALSEIGRTTIVGRDELKNASDAYQEPWKWDNGFLHHRECHRQHFSLAHIYSGSFSESVQDLKKDGTKVVYTIAAHDRFLSRREHEKFGINYAQFYPHLVEVPLWERYIQGYRLADCIVCPSEHAANVVRGYGAINRIEIIPHGTYLPETTPPIPRQFAVGYLGACAAADKGVIYLLQAWKKLNYRDAVLILAGKDSTSDIVKQMVEQFGGGNIILAGWQKKIADFYKQISLYVQPSVTEGFGIECVDAQAHSRPTLVSNHAAAETVPEGWRFDPFNIEVLAHSIHAFKQRGHNYWVGMGEEARKRAEHYTWDKIRERYKNLWKSILTPTKGEVIYKDKEPIGIYMGDSIIPSMDSQNSFAEIAGSCPESDFSVIRELLTYDARSLEREDFIRNSTGVPEVIQVFTGAVSVFVGRETKTV